MTQYRLLKDIGGMKVGQLVDRPSTALAHSWSAAGNLHYTLPFDDPEWFAPVLPHPPAKETYTIEMWHLNDRIQSDIKVEHHISLTPDQAEVVAKAIEALLQYCNDTPKNPAMPFFPKYLVDACEASRSAIQGGSAA